MSVQIPPDFDPSIRKLITEGRFRDENEIVAEGIRLVLRQDQLEKAVQAGLDDLDSGNRIEASEVYAEARQRVRVIEVEQGQ